MKSEDGENFFGHRHGWAQDNPIGLGLESRRQHVYLIGQTGTGKSTLIRNLLLQDIEAGRGVAVIDPHGDLADEILNHIPRWRTDEVVYFDPCSRHPFAMNPFLAMAGSWHMVAAGIVSTFRKIWQDSWGPRLEYILYASLGALLQCENTSLLGIQRMLIDPRYRLWVVRQITDPMIRSFWINEFESYERRFLQEAIAPVQNKVGQLLFSPPLRNILGQPVSRVDFRFLMDNRRIFIANLRKGQIGETHASLLGSLLITGFEIAALSRSDCLPAVRQEFFLYADEFQTYATDSFASILSESRKYGLCLTLAHQYVGQLSDDTAAAVFGNVGTLIAFRVGEADASVLEQQFGGGYTRNRFTDLENFEICARLLNQEPFVGKSLAPLETNRERREIVMRRSRQKYNTKRWIVEERIEKWLRRRH